MKRIFLLMFFSVINLWAMAQEDSMIVQKGNLYGQFGSTIPFSASQEAVFNITGVTEVNKTFAFLFGFYLEKFLHRDFHMFEHRGMSEKPFHDIREVNVALGKIWVLPKNNSVSVFTGPSYVQYDEPYNLRQRPSSGWFSSPRVDFDTRMHHLLGWSTRADYNFIPFKSFGFSVGVLLNWNNQLTSGGLQVNILFGRFARKSNASD